MREPGDCAPPSVAGHVPRPVQRWRDGAVAEITDAVAEEVPLAMLYNGQPFAVMMATPCDLHDFALGFSLSEGLITDARQLLGVQLHPQVEGIELAIEVAAAAPGARLDEQDQRLLAGRGGCGICGARALEDVMRPPAPVANPRSFTAAAMRQALAVLARHQPLNAVTGATHVAAWADADGQVCLVREDVARHNALDKLIGALARDGRDAGAGMLLVSSRASYEMVAKAARAGIGLVVAVSAPTALAIELARGAGVCLVGFARADGYNVYTHPQRLRASGSEGLP